MTKELRDKWVEALRSGKYEQGTLYLRKGDCYCCLGVLCDLDGANWVQSPLHSLYVFSANGDMTAEPVAFREIHCISDQRCQRLQLERKQLDSIITLNDRGRPFAEIADWIETNVPVEA